MSFFNINIKPIFTVLIISSCSMVSTVPPGSQGSRNGNVAKVRTVKDIIVRDQKVSLAEYSKVDSKSKVTIEENSADIIKSRNSKGLSLSYKQKHFKFWKNYFSKKERARFKRHLNNGLKFKPVVEAVFKEHGLPVELFYVGLIESGYNTHISSSAQAVGPWQFIKGTATRYGLRVDGHVDERRSIHKSSVAAANYFKDLYNIFGSWELALCAYNKGEYGIIRAIRKGKTRDYLELVQKKLIPKETIYYIPKIAAAIDLVESEFKHLNNHVRSDFYKNTKQVALGKSFSAARLRKSIGLSRKEFKKLNPELKRDWIKVRRRHSVTVPNNYTDKLISYVRKENRVVNLNLDRRLASKSYKKSNRKGKSYSNRSTSIKHRVKSGENLTRIAKKYHLTVRELKKLNGMRSSKIYPGKNLIVGRKSRSVSSIPSQRSSKFHIVKKGDFLGKIARRYNISLKSLKKINGMKRNNIRVGEKLLVRKAKGQKTYVVKRGDSLSRIARLFGTSVKKILSANSFTGKKIFPRQKIIIPLES
jgi:membrane-bound lytic murein transglycosylase D